MAEKTRRVSMISSLNLLIILIELLSVVEADPTASLCLGKEKVTKLRFYVQDFIGGDKAAVWAVARSNLTGLLPSKFGLVAVLDNPVTSGPETDSRELGRIQGLIALSDFHEISLAMLVNVVFTAEEYYKGSTLNILARNPLLEKSRELTIVGGTGAFRMARGYIVTSTYAVDSEVHRVYQYDAVVFHHHVE